MPDFASYYYYQDKKLEIIPQTDKVAVFCKTAPAAKKLSTALVQQQPVFKWQYTATERIATLNTSYEEARAWVEKVISPESVFIYPVCRYANKRLNGYSEMLFNGTFIVRFRNEMPQNQVEEICKQQKCQPLKQLSGKNAPYLVQYQGTQTAFVRTINTFREQYNKETVLYAHPDFINAVRLEGPPTPPAMQQGVFKQITLPDAWAWLSSKNIKTGNVRVAVLDEGIHHKPANPALNLASRADQIGGTCPYNLKNTHGTSVAGIIGATNANLLLGVAFDAELADVRISYLDNNQNRQSSTSKVTNGLQAAIGWGARVINISWSHPLADAVREKIQLALNSGIVVCCAAGNYVNNESQSVRFPASLSGEMPLIAVAACDASGNLINWSTATGFGSCRGPEVTLTAPGLSIPALSVNTSGQPIGINNFAGTSAATALVSGAAALLLGAKPALTPSRTRDILKNSATAVGTVLNTEAALLQI